MSKKEKQATAAAVAAVQERLVQARMPPTVGEMMAEEMIAHLEALGGKMAGQDAIVYDGEQFRLPESMRGNLAAAEARIKEIRESEESKISFTRQFNNRPDDGCVAFSRAMNMVFGTQGVGKSIQTMFGERKPEIRMVQTGLDEQAEAPNGKVAFAEMDAEFYLGTNWDEELGPVFVISCNCPRKYRQRVEGFFAVIDNILKTDSIYKGKAINGAETPGFFNPFAVDSSRVIYTASVLNQLEEVVMTPLRHTNLLRVDGIPVKRCCMFAGPYGTGKSLAGMLVAQVAVQNGWTFILVRAEDDPFEALKTAQLYAPAVVMVEDIDNLAAGKSRAEITRLLDAVDSVSVKGKEIMLISTTNFPDDVDMSMLRPGRTDVIIDFAHLDKEDFQRLIPAVLPVARLAADLNYAAVAEAFHGLFPAFATEACYRALFHSLRKNEGRRVPITEEDLLAGAQHMQEHRARMEAAAEARRFMPTVHSTMNDLVEGVIRRTRAMGSSLEVESEQR